MGEEVTIPVGVMLRERHRRWRPVHYQVFAVVPHPEGDCGEECRHQELMVEATPLAQGWRKMRTMDRAMEALRHRVVGEFQRAASERLGG